MDLSFASPPLPVTSPTNAPQALLHVVMLVMQSVAADMRNSDRFVEPTQMGTLMRIAMGPCTMTDLARHKAVSLSTVSKSVGMLVRRGWVERWIDHHDRRQTLVRLTLAGRRALSAIQQKAEQHVDEKLAALAPAERRQLIAVLKRVTDVLSESTPGASLAIATTPPVKNTSTKKTGEV